jgi:hypothetical protein
MIWLMLTFPKDRVVINSWLSTLACSSGRKSRDRSKMARQLIP